jgi:hypothetical protein
MKKIIIVTLFMLLASCADLPVSWGVQSKGVNASYSAKGGLVIDINPTIFVEDSGK